MTEIRHPNENLISYTKADLKLCDSHMTKWFFLKSRTWTAAIGHNSAAARFQWNCVWGSRFSQNFGNGIGAGVPWNVCYCFLNAVWASATGAFYIVSHTLVIGSQKVGKIVYYFAVLTLATWWRVYQTVTLTVTLVLASITLSGNYDKLICTAICEENSELWAELVWVPILT